ncbi:MAG: LolA family protein [Rectinemataceae bacterium]
MISHKPALAAMVALCATLTLAAQDITTADQYFQQVSDRYAQVTDYECKLAITAGKTAMAGNLIYHAPTLLRIDFAQPSGQVIAFDGQILTVYVPEYRAVLSQSVGSNTGGAGASLATRDGLRMMRRSYSAAFESTPEAVALEGGGGERVIRLMLTRKTVAEGFRTIIVSISPESKLIRRLEGLTLANERFIFDFTGLRINQNIPETRFIYDSPASANMYNNFLFNSDDTKN